MTAKSHARQGEAERSFRLRRRQVVAGIVFVMLLFIAIVGTGSFEQYIQTTRNLQGDVVRQVVIVGIFSLLLVSQMEGVTRGQRLGVPLSLAILIGYCLLSVSWAIDPFISVRRLVLTVLVIWIVARSVGELGTQRTLALTRAVLVIVLALSFAAVFLTDLGIHQVSQTDSEYLEGDWRGIMPHKNAAGPVCAITVLMFVFDRKRSQFVASFSVVAGALIFLFFSNSRTALVVLVMALACGGLMQLYSPRHRSPAVLASLIGIFIVGAVATTYSQVVMDTLNDPYSFSGRMVIWTALLEYAAEHPWAGAGFGSFWQIGEASPIMERTDWVAQFASHGHNGYLDLLVTIGVPGLLLAVLVLFILPVKELMVAPSASRQLRALLISILVFVAGHNLTETSLLDRSSLMQVILVTVIALIWGLAAKTSGRHGASWISRVFRKPRTIRGRLRLVARRSAAKPPRAVRPLARADGTPRASVVDTPQH